MRNIAYICLALAVGTGLVWQTNASAGDGEKGKGPDVKEGEKHQDANDGMSTLKLADDLAAWGRANQHAGAVAIAARLMSTVKCTPMEKVELKKNDGKVDAGGKKAQAVTAESLMAEAKALCGSDEKIKAQIDALYAMGAHSRGNLSGAMYHTDICCSEDEYFFTFQGGNGRRSR